jgi:2-oxoglutarate ferredoxin oxidoreductase subunit alpha
VIVDIQSVGPAVGLSDYPAQGDIMQSRWGSHGDYEIIALSPSSPQEMFDFTIKAFNLSERYRVPVMLMADEHIAHIKEQVTIPAMEEIKIEGRRYYDGPIDKYLPFKRDADLVPRMVDIGKGYKFHITGLTHDDRGYPVMNEECHEYNIHPLVRKIRLNADKIIDTQELNTGDAEIVIVSYGSTSRTALKAMNEAREAGIKVGSLKLNTIWPFPDKRVAELAKKVKAFIVAEMNYGQIAFEVERCSYGNANVVFVPCVGKGIDETDDLVSAIKQAVKEKEIRKGIIEYQG